MALVVAASRMCLNVVPDGPAPTPFSHLPRILANSAWVMDSFDSGGTGQLLLTPLKPFSPPPDTHSLVLRPFHLRLLSSPHGFPALEMVIAGAPEPSPGLAAAWSAVVARPPAGPERVTMATEPPLPPAPKHVTAVSEKTPPHAPAAPLAGAGAGPTAPAAVPSAPPASPGSLAPLVEPSASAPAGGVAEPPAPVPGAPVAPNASVPCLPAQASASSPKAASATTGEPAPSVAPAAAGRSAPAVTAVVPAGQPSRPPSPDRRLSRPHSPAPQQERESSRRRRNSSRRYQRQAQWPAHPGGNAGWGGPRGRGGGGGYRPPVTMADLQREVSRAVREERAAQSQSSSLRAAPAHVAPRRAVPPVVPPPAAVLPPPVLAPSAHAPAASTADPGSRLRLPPVPPVAGVEFVPAGGGVAGAQYPPYLAPDEPLPFLAVALQPPQTRVPEATLGQLHCLVESLHALLLIQVLAHSSLPAIPADSFHDRPRETCLDAVDQLSQLLAPALAAPVEGGAAAVGQLDEAVRGLRRHLRAGSGAAAIGASTLVVRELWRTLTGILHALGAHRM
ncbi:unnamed protein product [Closterium sp. Naga37s-1]|nr:unnamed protein product [Closterium sp. Naga37s-1]